MSYEHGTRMTSVGKTWIRCKVNAGALVDTAFNRQLREHTTPIWMRSSYSRDFNTEPWLSQN